MPVYRLQCSFGADSPLARDRFVITPHFNVALPGADVDALCEDLADALDTWDSSATREIVVKGYDAQGTVPVFPVGDAVRSPGVFPLSNSCRELAVCLSFFSERNRPRQRGRLYIPMPLFTGAATAGVRPAAAYLTKVADLVPIFTALGGTDVDWCVYSPTDNMARTVTDWWVDNEWDIMRSRGLRSTDRTVGTTGE